MSADKTTRADPLAEWLDGYRFRKPADILRAVQAAAELRRIPALEDERDEADRKAGAAERRADRLADAIQAGNQARDKLAAEIEALTGDIDRVKFEREQLRALARDHVRHVFAGDCPDELDRSRRDPNCPACAVLQLSDLAESNDRNPR